MKLYKRINIIFIFSDIQQSTVILSVHEPWPEPEPEREEDLDLFHQQEDEISLNDLFPDPSDFVPPSPTFTFPPLPPTPPEQEKLST